MSTQTLFTDTLQDAFVQAGLPYPGTPDAGGITRFSVNGKKSDPAGWLRVFPDGNGAVFGSWRDDVTFVWQRRRDNRQSKVDLQRMRAEQQRRQRERQQAEADRHHRVMVQARKLWNAANEANTCHPYLQSKMVKPNGLRQQGNALLVPLVADGGLVNLQRIYPNGDKRFLAGGRIKGCYSPLGIPDTADTLYICEGWATGATIHQLTGQAVFCAMNCGNLMPVAMWLRQQAAGRHIVIAADNDRFTDGNPGVTKATQAARAIGAEVLVPSFPDGVSGSDYNDLFVSEQQGGRHD